MPTYYYLFTFHAHVMVKKIWTVMWSTRCWLKKVFFSFLWISPSFLISLKWCRIHINYENILPNYLGKFFQNQPTPSSFDPISALSLSHSTKAARQIGSLGNVLWLRSFKESLVIWRKKSFFNRHLAHCTFISFDYETASNTYISRAKLIIFHDFHDSNSIFMQ